MRALCRLETKTNVIHLTQITQFLSEERDTTSVASLNRHSILKKIKKLEPITSVPTL